MSSPRRAVAFPAGLSPSLATASGVIALTVVAVDQATKALVRWVLPLCSPTGCNGVHAGPFVFVNRTNPGAAFGIGAASTACVLLAATSCLLIPPLGARLSAAGANRGTVALPGAALDLGPPALGAVAPRGRRGRQPHRPYRPRRQSRGLHQPGAGTAADRGVQPGGRRGHGGNGDDHRTAGEESDRARSRSNLPDDGVTPSSEAMLMLLVSCPALVQDGQVGLRR